MLGTVRYLSLILLSIAALQAQEPTSYERQLVQRLNSITRGMLPQDYLCDIEKLAADETPYAVFHSGKIPPLFEAHPSLARSISYASCADITPIISCKNLSPCLGTNLFIKDDGYPYALNGLHLFTGNKRRKLEFLLADAKAHGAECILTRGGTASNHALATTIYAANLGMKSICILADQPSSYGVRRNLLLQEHYGAKLRITSTRMLHYVAMADEFVSWKEQTGKFPYLIGTGGSNGRGALGFFNAILELKKQIDEGLMPEPDVIVVPVGDGSGGTTAGLIFGIKACGFKSQLIAVNTEPESDLAAIENQTKRIFKEIQDLLKEADPSFPELEFPISQLTVLYHFAGEDYGLFTEEGMNAKKLLWDTEKIKLDGTYTAKAFAGLLDYCKQHEMKNKTVLFWNTYCGDDFEDLTSTVDYKKLPKIVHHYFEEDVQPLDRK